MDPGGSRPPPGAPATGRNGSSYVYTSPTGGSYGRDDYKTQDPPLPKSTYTGTPHTLPPPPSHTTSTYTRQPYTYTRSAALPATTPARRPLASVVASTLPPPKPAPSSRYSERSDSIGRLSNSSLYSHNSSNGAAPPPHRPPLPAPAGSSSYRGYASKLSSPPQSAIGSSPLPRTPPQSGSGSVSLTSVIGSVRGTHRSPPSQQGPASAAARLAQLEKRVVTTTVGHTGPGLPPCGARSPDDQKGDQPDDMVDDAYRAQLQHERDKLAAERAHEMDLLRRARQELEEAESRYQRELKRREAGAQAKALEEIQTARVARRAPLPPVSPAAVRPSSRSLARRANLSPVQRKIEDSKELTNLQNTLEAEMQKLKTDKDVLQCEKDKVWKRKQAAEGDHIVLQKRSDQQQSDLLRTLNRIHQLRQDTVTFDIEKQKTEQERHTIATQQRNLALEKHDVKKRNLILMKMKVQFQKVAEANQTLKASDVEMDRTIMDIKDQSDRLANYIENRELWTVGSKVLVFSMSQKKWHEGIVYTLKNDGRKLVIQYELDNGDINQKELDRHHKHLKPINVDRSTILRSPSLRSLGSGGMLERPLSPTGSIRSISSAGSVMSFKVGNIDQGFSLPPALPGHLSSPRSSYNGDDWDTQSMCSVLSEDPVVSSILDLAKLNDLIDESTKAVETFRADPYATPQLPLSKPPPKSTAPT